MYEASFLLPTTKQKLQQQIPAKKLQYPAHALALLLGAHYAQQALAHSALVP